MTCPRVSVAMYLNKRFLAATDGDAKEIFHETMHDRHGPHAPCA
jgi:hypothetical protein